MVAVAPEALVIDGGEPPLPDRGAGLEVGKVRGPAADAQRVHPRADRAGADDRDEQPALAEQVNLLRQPGDLRLVQPAVRARQRRRADLDDELPHALKKFRAIHGRLEKKDDAAIL